MRNGGVRCFASDAEFNDHTCVKGNVVDKKEDKNTRYFIDLDLKRRRIINRDFSQRDVLSQELAMSYQQRIFITRGQFNKLIKKCAEH